ncbi:hypothetical protein MBAV_000870 [Candidatus Magnetobacterium bavaricum]|uniref:Uncharacterized protein n=1 Tax=Candidatus Magnetobacterium bavaricum TaxID=29290 RepID=A0A0F3H1Z1_9BACT|nr:hypothetical protein MBAV_000870 [Candidatus Magnetobacterium bavaricum]
MKSLLHIPKSLYVGYGKKTQPMCNPHPNLTISICKDGVKGTRVKLRKKWLFQ